MNRYQWLGVAVIACLIAWIMYLGSTVQTSPTPDLSRTHRPQRPSLQRSPSEPLPPAGSIGQGLAIPSAEQDRRTAFSNHMNLLTQSLETALGSEQDRTTLIHLLAESPQRAVEWTETLPAGERKAAMQLLLIMEWTKTDFPTAWEWAKHQSEDALSIAALFSHARAGGQIIAEAGDWLAIGGDRADMRSGALIGILSDSRQWELLEPLIQKCPEHQQERLLNSCIYSIAASEPAKALEMANRVEDPNVRQEQVRSVLDGWSRERLPDLATYALSRTDPSARAMALDFFAYNMLTSGRSEELKQWLETHPQQAGIDTRGMALLAHKIPGTDHAFEFALHGISKIPDDTTRTRLFSEVILQLSQINSAEAARMAETSTLIDTKAKQQLLNTIQPQH